MNIHDEELHRPQSHQVDSGDTRDDAPMSPEERRLMRALARCWAERDAAVANLTAVQRRCTEQAETIRDLRAKLLAAHSRDTERKAEMAGRFHLPTAVREFMAAAGQAMPATPTVPSDAVVRLRLRLVAEEFVELLGACLGQPSAHDYDAWNAWNILTSEDVAKYIDAAPVLVDLPEAADALADIAYVVEGTALALGIRSDDVLAAVQAANMAKDFSNVPEGGKVRKPAGWVAPDIAGVLAAQGRKP
jgi:predicted HAD superfamily Cof-like phosphohydrolase